MYEYFTPRESLMSSPPILSLLVPLASLLSLLVPLAGQWAECGCQWWPGTSLTRSSPARPPTPTWSCPGTPRSSWSWCWPLWGWKWPRAPASSLSCWAPAWGWAAGCGGPGPSPPSPGGETSSHSRRPDTRSAPAHLLLYLFIYKPGLVVQTDTDVLLCFKYSCIIKDRQHKQWEFCWEHYCDFIVGTFAQGTSHKPSNFQSETISSLSCRWRGRRARLSAGSWWGRRTRGPCTSTSARPPHRASTSRCPTPRSSLSTVSVAIHK